MKNLLSIVIAFAMCYRVAAQAQELQQLKLDLEKLAQFKLMLSEMKSGYQTLVNGYNSVRDIGRSNFDLHQNYLDGLLLVSPQLKSNPAMQRIFSSQTQLVSNYKVSLTKFKTSGVFSTSELTDVSNSCNAIVDIANADTELLLVVLTPGKMRMSDGERADVINQVDQSIQKQVSRLKAVDDEYSKVMMLRLQKKRDIETMKRLGKQ